MAYFARLSTLGRQPFHLLQEGFESGFLATVLGFLEMDASKKRGRKSADEISTHLPWILRNLDELELLEECPIATLTSVRRLAETSYADSLFPSGMAIRMLIFESIESICADLEHLPAYRRECQFLNSVANGSTVAEFSRCLGLSREHVARTVQHRAMKLLTRAFLARAHE